MGDKWEIIDNLAPYSCSYKPGQFARIFAITSDLKSGYLSPLQRSRSLYNTFLPLGFEPGPISVIAQNCPSCNACVSLRVRVKDYPLGPMERFILRKNMDLSTSLREAHAGLEHFKLFKEYLISRHPQSNLIKQPFDDFLREGRIHSHLLDIRDAEGQLVASATLDLIDNAFSVYSIMYDQAKSTSQRSLGTAAIVTTILCAQQGGLEHVYLGSWVKDGVAMDYKKRFQNLEVFTGNNWVPFDPNVHTEGPRLQKVIPILRAP
jgi:arginyl-tRNA--protein-N-Asp/Glu arginylyltransferase